MNLYKLSQRQIVGYDTYDSCVVVAESADEARMILPSNYLTREDIEDGYDCWPTDPTVILVELLGTALDTLGKNRVVCASFNAG